MLFCLHTFSKTKFQVYGHITVSLSNENAHLYFSYITGWKSSFSSTAFKNPLFKYPIHPLVFKLDFKKAEESEIKLPTSVGSSKKQESSRKTSTSALLTMLKPLTVWITTNCGKFLNRWEYQTTLLASWEICMQVREQVRIGWNNILVPNRERSTSRLYIVTLLV